MQQPEIGNFVRELRCDMQLSQEKFADELAVTFATINHWKNGQAAPSLALKQTAALLKQLGRGEEIREIRVRASQKATEVGGGSKSGNA